MLVGVERLARPNHAVPPAKAAAGLDAALVGADAVDRARRVGLLGPAGGVGVAAQRVADQDDVVTRRREAAVRLVRQAELGQVATRVERQRLREVDELGADHADRAGLADHDLAWCDPALHGWISTTSRWRSRRRRAARCP